MSISLTGTPAYNGMPHLDPIFVENTNIELTPYTSDGCRCTMKKGILAMIVLSILLIPGTANPLFVFSQEEGAEFVPREVMVKFDSETSDSDKNDVIQQLDGDVLNVFDELNIYQVKISDELTVEEAMEIAQAAEAVEFAEPNFIFTTVDRFPDDPRFEEQWALNNEGQSEGTPDADIDGPEAWQIRNKVPKIVVGVTDTGCDLNHEDLDKNLWVNPGETGLDENGNDKSTNGIDDDNNGFVDDVHGADFVNNDGDPSDDNGHGTSVSGIIGAVGDNGTGVTGVAWKIQLMCLKFLNATGAGSTADAMRAIEYAIENDASLINASWAGGGPSRSLRAAIQEFGRVFVAAAGNASQPFAQFPAAFNLPEVISVAATDNNDDLAPFSNFGRGVDLGAPGVDNLTTGLDDTYISFTGTSAASPHAAGVAALVREEFPDLTEAEIKECIINGIDPKDSLNIPFTESGGRLNANQTLQCTSLPVEERGFVRIAHQGFEGLDPDNQKLGSRHNSYTWSMAMFKGQLYVGTIRDVLCLVALTDRGQVTENLVECPASVLDLDLRAEIWRYTFKTDTWELALRSPLVDVEFPDPTGTEPFALHIGYRSMAVHTEPDGEKALYVSTFGLSPMGQILRTTDGETFTNIFNPDSFPDVDLGGFRGLVSYKGKLFATPVGSGTDANASPFPVVIELEDSSTGTWRQVSEVGFGDSGNESVFELQVFDGFLYAGTGNESGFQLFKTNLEPDPDNPDFYLWERVLTDGAFRGPDNQAAVSMAPFKKHLYIGTAIEQTIPNDNMPPQAAELLRIDSQGEFDIICGDSRETPLGSKAPLSGRPAGCGNPFNVYIWRLAEHDGELYIGSFDNSVFLPTVGPLVGLPEDISQIIADETAGFDLWKTSDGTNLLGLTDDGLRNPLNYGARTLASTPYGLAIGTANPFTDAPGQAFLTGGTQIWLGEPQPIEALQPAELPDLIPGGDAP
jgi:hypothetical protein